MRSDSEIAEWCEANLFGPREIDGIQVPLTVTQASLKAVFVDVIKKWEDRDVGAEK